LREFLEDAHQHRDDGYGRAQRQLNANLPRRFYKEVGVGAVGDGFSVTLDGKTPRTPGQKLVIVPYRPIAETMAAEWAEQGEMIDPEHMPTVRLINSAIEAGDERVPALRAEVVKYAANDLLLYRAESPQSLVDEQEKHWDAALVKLARHFGIGFQPTVGIVHQPQPKPTLDRLTQAVADIGLIESVAMVSLVGITGSGLLVIAQREKLLTPDEVWTAAHVDEDHNIRLWGAVDEATSRRDKKRIDYDAALKVLEAIRA
jgi:chaperone required for assembly of F1-ATPase